ncbi:unnamed protein product [Pleuronectes platessa]|uniref:Uncharacterized protein n=1 Tax=Pleuronectes platessa TaxID=8262 RepID=A0A9N7VU39_PLEPL|nr:unnamed protein product [Pleuronectes platessa]
MFVNRWAVRSWEQSPPLTPAACLDVFLGGVLFAAVPHGVSVRILSLDRCVVASPVVKRGVGGDRYASPAALWTRVGLLADPQRTRPWDPPFCARPSAVRHRWALSEPELVATRESDC